MPGKPRKYIYKEVISEEACSEEGISKEATPEEAISVKAKACSEAFETYLKKLQLLCITGLQGQCDRFNAWASSTGVFAHPRTSLDFRLREAPDIRVMITGMLTAILQSIQSEKSSNTHAKVPGSGGSMVTMDHDAKKEITQAIGCISNDISLLYRLSFTIRQTRADKAYPKTTAELSLADEPSQSLKIDAHQFLTQTLQIPSKAVRERLALGILIRRNRFEHLQECYGTKPKTDATRLDKNSFCMSSAPLRVSWRSKTSSSPGHEMFFPAPPRACNGTEVKCPYCLTILPATNLEPEKWIKHFKADLDPYVCLFEQCQLPPDRMLFERCQDWIDHMRQSHLLKWCCETEDHEETFNTESDFRAHLQKFHVGDFVDDDLPALVEMSARPIGRTFDSCPFCGADDMLNNDLENHISDHLIALALLSLPPRDISHKGQHASCCPVDTQNSTSKHIPSVLRFGNKGGLLEGEDNARTPRSEDLWTPRAVRDDERLEKLHDVGVTGGRWTPDREGSMFEGGPVFGTSQNIVEDEL